MWITRKENEVIRPNKNVRIVDIEYNGAMRADEDDARTIAVTTL